MIGTSLGRYQVVEKIGQGGMAVVYRAKDEHLGRDVALKVLPDGILADDTARRRFRNEAHALSRLNHPNVETVYDYSTEGSLDFLVLELIPGTTLAETLRRGPLPEPETTRLGVQLADGLAAAHQEGVLHRDIKPANLFIVPEGRLKILDFGLAQVVEKFTASVTAAHLTASNQVVGTLPYMAPEQLRGEGADFRSDIYSVGAVLFEMVTGRRMIEETGLSAIIDRVVHGAPERPRQINPDVSPELEKIILRCVAKSPSRRFQSAQELRDALGAIDQPGVGAADDGSRRSPSRGRGLLSREVLLGSLALVVLAALAVRFARDRLVPGPSLGDPIRSIVVLPLSNLSGPEQQYFADGMTDMLIMDLAQIAALRVISRTSAMHYRGTSKLLPEIAKELGVDAVVEGTVLRLGDRVRIAVQLVDAREESAIWADRYEHDVVDILKLQGEVASAVAGNVRVALTRGVELRLGRELRVSPAAYEAYLKGRHFLGLRTPEGFGAAIDHLEYAVREDPRFAPAHAELANCFLLLGSIGYDVMPPIQAVHRARAAAETALEIDESSAEAQTAIAHIRHNIDWDWPAAEQGFRRAIELNPGYATAHQWYGFYLATRSRLDEAVTAQQRALEIDPLSPLIHASLGRLFYYRRDYEGAARHLRRALELDPLSLSALLVYGMVHLQEGRHEEARTLFEKGRDVTRGAPAFVAGLGTVHAAVGDTAAASATIEELAELARHRYVPSIYPAAVFASLGDEQNAVVWLERAYEERSEAVLYLGVEPMFDGLREDPRFQRIVSRVGGAVG